MLRVRTNRISHRPRFFALVVFLLSSLHHDPTTAATLAETHGFGARAIGMGGAFTAVVDDASALYYNPAGLAQIHGHQAHFEYLFVKPEVYVQKRPGGEEHFIDKWTKAPLAAIAIDLSRAIKLQRQIVMGWAAYFPDNTKSVYKVRYGTFYDPFYPQYGDSSADQSIMLTAGTGVEIFPWLLIGGGFTLQIHGQYVNIEVAVDPAGRPVTDKSRTDMDVTTEIYPLAGILLKPTERLRLGFSWRRQVEFIVAGGMQMNMKLVIGEDRVVPIPIPLTVEARGHFRPEQYALGISYRICDPLLLAADLTYYNWRPYVDEGARPLNPSMREIVVPRVGVEYSLMKDLSLRMGYGFQESPLRPQRTGGPVNLLDNDYHSISVGAGVFWDLFGVLGKPAQWSVFYQVQFLVPRTFRNVHPGGPDLRSSGTFHAFGFGIQFYL